MQTGTPFGPGSLGESLPLSEANLRRLVARQSFGDLSPYSEGDDARIEAYLRRVVAGLSRSKLIGVEAKFDHYGSGYASYVDVFCYKRGGQSTTEKGGVLWVDGLTVYLCRLAPFASIGRGERTKHDTGGSSDYLDPSKVGECPPGDWSREVSEVRTKLVEHYGFTLPSQDELRQRLPFETRIPTVLADLPYSVFDALFHWED